MIIGRDYAEKAIATINDCDDAREREAAFDLVSRWAGEGDPRPDLMATAEAIGPDYICALGDGSILSFGEDAPGRRKLVIIDQA